VQTQEIELCESRSLFWIKGFLQFGEKYYSIWLGIGEAVMGTLPSGDDGLRKAFEAFLLKHHAHALYELILVVDRNEPTSPPSLHIKCVSNA
jgi:hypothetical protein|tara:strand:+ start:2061 stop:2336 length:276 start_codon:yes stop_codon:yes gene_type:complete